MLFSSLSTYLSDKTLSHWQTANDGIWEEAYRIRPQTKHDAFIHDYVRQFEDIALEAFLYDKDDNDFCFFGLRIKALSVEEKEHFLKTVTGSLPHGSSLNDIKSLMQDLLGYDTWLEHQPELLEIGAEGFWKSYGPYKLWDSSHSDHPIATEDDIRRDAPHILETFERPMMVECAWKTPIPAWLGIPVSEKINDNYQFSSSLYNNLIQKIK